MAKKTNNPSILLKIKNFFSNEKVRIIIGILLVFCAFYLFSSLFSFIFYGDKDYNLLKHSLDELSQETKVYENWIGYVGAKMANTIINQWFGVAALFWPWFLIRAGIQLIHPIGRYNLPKKLINLFFITIWGSVATAFVIPTISAAPYIQLGGNHGNEIVKYLSTLIGNIGLGAIIFLTLLIFLIDPAISWTKRIYAYIERRNKERKERIEELGVNEEDDEEDDFQIIDEEEEDVEEKEELEETTETEETEDTEETEEPADTEDTEEIEETGEEIENEEDSTEQPNEEDSDEVEFSVTVAEGEGSEIVEQNTDYDPTLDLEYYKYPSYDLLKDFGEIKSVDAAEQQENKERITQTLRNYGITIKKIDATVGPTITLYEIVPDDGIRISKIRNLGDDIALSLAATGIRIIAPIPGRGTVGIEVPNKKPQIVPMRSLIASEKFQNTSSI